MHSINQTITTQAGEFCASLNSSSVPDQVQAKAKICIFYGLGIGLLCLTEKTAEVASESVIAMDGVSDQSGATCFVNGIKTPIGSAVFSNAVLLHARCQEDTSGTAHLGVSVIPVALAMLESGLGNKKSFLSSVIAGYEVGGALERVLGKKTMSAGFRASPLYGTLAAAATAARMMDLPAPLIGSAIANAALFTGGTLQSIPEGTDEWRYQVGVAARTGLHSAMLAKKGALSTTQSIEGAQGFSHSFARDSIDQSLIKWADFWNLPNVTFKPYPVCAHNQTPTALGVALFNRIKPEKIRHLNVRINPYVVPGMLERGPFKRVAETLMSTYFCIASAASHGKVTMDTLASYNDVSTNTLISKTTIELDPALPFPCAAVDVTTIDGEEFSLIEMKRFEDYSLSQNEVRNQLLRLSKELSIDQKSVQLIESFSFSQSGLDISQILLAYEIARKSLHS